MIRKFKPTWMIEEVSHITPQFLKEQGIQAIMTDLDNTLIAWNCPNGTPELKEWLADLDNHHIQVIVVSNNNSERVAEAVAPFQLTFIAPARKPLKKGFKAAQEQLNVSKDACVMIGDQLLTDIYGGNRFGIKTILVKPLVTTDAWNTRINRFIERWIMKKLKKQNPKLTWQKEVK